MEETPIKHGLIYDTIRWTIEITDEHMLEIQNSTCSIIVGLVILVGGDRLYARNPQAWQMFEVLPMVVWGLLYLGAGFAHLIFLKLDLQTCRKWVLLLKATLWVFLGTALAVGVSWIVPAVYIYYVFALIAFRGYFKIQVEANGT